MIKMYIENEKEIIAFKFLADRDQYLKDNPKSKIISRTNAEKKLGAYAVSIARIKAMEAHLT